MSKLSKPQAGYSLIEILVAVLVISVGLLGVATLQTRGQQFNHFSYLRTQATFLAYDLMERMRTNMAGVQNGAYNDNNGVCPTESDEALVEALEKCDNLPCSPGDLAVYDLANWRYMVCDVLPWMDKPPSVVDETCEEDEDYLGDYKKHYKVIGKDTDGNGSDDQYKIFIQWIENEDKIKCQVWRF